MAPECRFILPSGRTCRCAALRNQPFCRHHAPKTGGPPIAKRKLYSPLAKWRAVGRGLPWLVPEEIPCAIFEILDALTGRDPSERLSDLTAGRYLRTLLARLGRVPFPVPELAPAPEPAPAPALGLAPRSASPGSQPGRPTFNESLDAMLALAARHGVFPSGPRPAPPRPSRV